MLVELGKDDGKEGGTVGKKMRGGNCGERDEGRGLWRKG